MKQPLLEAIEDRILIANGAMGTMFAARGLSLTNSALANLEHPEVMADIFRQYREAGAEVFQSNTFAANRLMLRHAGFEEQHDEINCAAMRLLREAIGDDCYLAANIGPTGEMLEPLGTLSAGDAAEVFRSQAEVLLEGRPDFFLLETFEALEELEAAARGVQAVAGHLPLAITFSFSQPSGRSMMGVSPVQAAATMVELGAQIAGSNCGLPEVTLQALREIAGVTDLPLMVQANAGLPEMREGQTCFSGTPEDSAALAKEAAAIGARIIGGCCGTTPEHIRAMAEAVQG